MKNKVFISTIAGIFIMAWACSEKKPKQQDSQIANFAVHLDSAKQNTAVPDVFQVSLKEQMLDFKIPTLHSASTANYQGNWILIGGRKDGRHSMDKDPPAFRRFEANDSIWVVNLTDRTSKGVPVPANYARNLSGTNQQHYQVDDKLYITGGFTAKDTSSVADWTSDLFFEIDIPSLIAYVGSEGSAPSLDQVFTKVVQDPYVQVTGGEMLVVNNHFYIIGGQNYTGPYIPGNTGTYTNAIRKFDVMNTGSGWQITDTLSLIDQENLHRRDFNMAETVLYDAIDTVGAVIYGGVFTKNDLAFRNPVYIDGLVSGQPEIDVDTTFLQKTNLYTSAKIQAAMFFNDKGWFYNHTTFLGGISYMGLNTVTDSLSVPGIGDELPFSNLISSFLTDGMFYSVEKVQLPPNEMLPTYLGANAAFFAVPGFELDGHPELLDLNKIFASGNLNEPVLVGYLYGGIVSPVPNPFSSNSNYSTSANKKLYQVLMKMELPGS